MRGSFIHRVLFFEETDEFALYENKEKPFVDKQAAPWKNLPRNVWVIWDTGLKSSRVITQLSIEKMREKAEQSGFKLHIVDLKNMHQYLDENTIKRIDYAVKNAAIKTHDTTKTNLMRIALVVKHGGIYMDSTFILLDNLDWLVNIAREPSQYIYNRYGKLPRLLMTFHPWYGNPADWTVDPRVSTKKSWQLAY